MHQLDVPKLVAGCCALAGFAIAIIAGLAADNAVDAIVTRAIVSMGGCYFLGMLIGLAAESAIKEATDPVAEVIDAPDARAASGRALKK